MAPRRWKLGLTLALVTAVLWGMLPIALLLTLSGLDAYTITWVRFLVAALVLGAVLAVAGRVPALRSFARRDGLLLAVALFGLVGNYVLYLLALHYSSPTINQVVSQLSPILLLLGGVVLFHERFSGRQWLGLAFLLVGLPLFFNRRLPELAQLDAGLGRGVGLVLLASLVWSFYGLAQKQLMQRLEPAGILLLLYAGAALFTMMSMALVEQFAPSLLRAEQLNAASVVGALFVVGGSAACALGGEVQGEAGREDARSGRRREGTIHRGNARFSDDRR
ncbi:MAG TPA: DMT family transporter [Steroidobacteraceae bacterium]|nr:DMT family transporter [Steroidobacteraceae bacterium]